MAFDAQLTVGEAADALGVTPAAIRQRVSSGALPATKVGRQWLIDAEPVAALQRGQRRSGRRLSPPVAWAVILLSSGDASGPTKLLTDPRARTRARAWTKTHALVENAAQLRDRARAERFLSHPAELVRLRRRDDLMATGMSAAKIVGLVGGNDGADLYAPLGAREAIVDEHGLFAGAGPATLRWVPDQIWPSVQGDTTPPIAVLLDLLESDDPRARREAAKLLSG